MNSTNTKLEKKFEEYYKRLDDAPDYTFHYKVCKKCGKKLTSIDHRCKKEKPSDVIKDYIGEVINDTK